MNTRQSTTVPGIRVALGVDVAAGRLIVARATRSGRGAAIAAVADPVAELAGAGPRVAVAACLPERESFSRWLEAPFASRSKARRVLPSMLDVQLPFPLAECVYRAVAETEAASGSCRTLVAVARLADIRRRLDSLREAGVDPHVLDQEGLALWARGLVEAPPEGGGLRVVAYWGEDRLTLAVGRGRELAAAHTMRQPRPDEIDRLLRAGAREPGPGGLWLWCGPSASDRASVEALHAAVSARWPGECRVADAPAGFLARALAERAICPAALPCNFRVGGLAHPGVVAMARRSAILVRVAFLALGLGLCGVNLAWQTAVGRREAAMRGEMGRLAASVAGSVRVPSGGEVLIARRALDREASALAPVLRLYRPSAASTLRDLIDQAARDGVALELVSIAPGSVAVEGVAADPAACERLAAGLRQAGYPARIERRESAGKGAVRFSIITAKKP